MYHIHKYIQYRYTCIFKSINACIKFIQAYINTPQLYAYGSDCRKYEYNSRLQKALID